MGAQGQAQGSRRILGVDLGFHQQVGAHLIDPDREVAAEDQQEQ